MNRRNFIKNTGILAGAVTAGNPAGLTAAGWFDFFGKGGSRSPNLLYIFTDEHPAKGWSRGIPELKTPNMDRLAREGTVVDTCVSNNPICVPHRATLFTGLYGHQNGFVNNHTDFALDPALPSWSTVLKANGYTMGYIGKWHLTPNCENPVWENPTEPQMDKRIVAKPAVLTPPNERHGFSDLWIQSSNHNYPRQTYVWDKDGKYKKTDDYAPTFLTDRFLEFIEDHKDDEKPFCGVLSILPPHPSYAGALEHWDEYYKSIETPQWGNVPSEFRNPEMLNALKEFYAQISSVDEEFGRILDKLDEWGLRENTIVIFTSDHGDLHYAHGEKWKRFPWDESVLVPFIIRRPGTIPANQTSDLLLGSIDLAPTLLGLTGHGEQIPSEMQGMDLSGPLCGQPGPVPASQFIFYNLMEDTSSQVKKQPHLVDYRGVRTRRWTYTLQKNKKTGEVSPWLLYDNNMDKLQMNNLAHDSAYESLRQDLAKEIRRHLTQVGELEWLENRPRDRSQRPGTYKVKG